MGGVVVVGLSVNFEFKVGEDINNVIVIFNNDIYLGKVVNLRVDVYIVYFNGNVYLGKFMNLRVNGYSVYFKNIDVSKSDNGLNIIILDFSGVIDKVNINKFIIFVINVNIKNFDIKELVVIICV